jgi:hypothetical protein
MKLSMVLLYLHKWERRVMLALLSLFTISSADRGFDIDTNY